MIASDLNLRPEWSKDGDRQPQEYPRLMAVLVAILALLNVSATMLMAGSWASMTDSMLELERSMHDRLTDPVD